MKITLFQGCDRINKSDSVKVLNIMIWLLLLTISTYIVLTSGHAVWVVSSKTEQLVFSIFFIIGLIGWIRFEKIKTQISEALWIEKRSSWLALVLLSFYVLLTSDIIKVSEDTESWFSILGIIGFIGWVKYVNRKAEEGGNWLSNKPTFVSRKKPTFVSREIDPRKKRTVLRLVD